MAKRVVEPCAGKFKHVLAFNAARLAVIRDMLVQHFQLESCARRAVAWFYASSTLVAAVAC